MRGGRRYREKGEMAEAEEIIICATSAISGGTNILSVLRQNKLDRAVCMSHN